MPSPPTILTNQTYADVVIRRRNAAIQAKREFQQFQIARLVVVGVDLQLVPVPQQGKNLPCWGDFIIILLP